MGSNKTEALLTRYLQVRNASEMLAKPLTTEDQVIQTMPDVSPTKWHLAHTTWFFETLILAEAKKNYAPFHPDYRYLFNSYYNSIGPQFVRAHRGTLSRPTVDEIRQYRAHVDEQMSAFLSESPKLSDAQYNMILLGTHHEQQHQELMVTDIKHVLASNPLHPAYKSQETQRSQGSISPLSWHTYDGGVHEVGYQGTDFHFDNEGPRHRTYLQPFQLAHRPVTVGEYLEFIEDNGYKRPEFWLSDGWATVQREDWNAPLYWHFHHQEWKLYTLAGVRSLDPHEPVCHVSYFEADAYARWAGARLPTEFEWEFVAQQQPIQGHFAESQLFHPTALQSPSDGKNLPNTKEATLTFEKLYGDVWEWTASPYTNYPGFKPAEGAIGEYNGKFMCNQMVLRGGSCATPQNHIRPTYRNFFPAHARWQFTGLRLAR